MRFRSAPTLAAVLLILGALIVAGGLYLSHERTSNAASNANSAPRALAPERMTVSILGDSYTVGVGSTRNTGFTANVCTALNWFCKTDAQAGTGYTNVGEADDGFAVYEDRVQAIIDREPEVVVIQGGTNDSDAPFERIQAAASDTFMQLRKGLPEARIIAVSTTAPPAIKDGRELVVRDAIATAAADNGVTFIDPIAEGWLGDGDYIQADELHPTDDGYLKYATRWIEDMRALGLAAA